MYSQRTNYVLIGFFVISMVVALIASLALITGRTGASDTYYVVLGNVADIKYGTQVRYEGFPVGQVEEITPEPDGARMRFRVEVSVQEGWRIPDDSLARIGASTFLSAKTIDIASGESGQVTPVGGQIASAPPVDIFSTISNTASEISELNRKSVAPLLKSLNSLVRTAERGAPRITEELITFTERLNATLAPLRAILETQPYLCGESPAYADYIFFGSLMWQRCSSPLKLFDANNPIPPWRARLMSAFDGYAAEAPGYET